MNELCPCGSGREYADCCQPIITGTKPAATAEALMRSRYSAYVKAEIGHIVNSCVHDENLDEASTRRWSEKAQWLGLKIVRTEQGGAEDKAGVVEFEASYILDNLKEEHHETAKFVRQNGAWLYYSGDVKILPVVRVAPKVGRNDPCPCGSGKKYKQCCG